jgi:hypothetical protein
MRMIRVSTCSPLAHLDLLALFSQSGLMHTRITIFLWNSTVFASKHGHTPSQIKLRYVSSIISSNGFISFNLGLDYSITDFRLRDQINDITKI